MEDPYLTEPPPDPDDPHRTVEPPKPRSGKKQTKKRKRKRRVDPVAETASNAAEIHGQETQAPAGTLGGLVAGRYRLERELARGGMGVVYVGWDEEIERPVAVKQLLAARGASPREIERFRREGQAVARLQHPRIVRVYELVEEGGVLHLIMELVDGESAMDRLKREQLLDVEEAIRIGIGVAEALEAAHAEGVAHRDVKPHNVLLTKDGQVKLTDFGLAKVARLVDLANPDATPTRVLAERRSLTADGQVMGTPVYMSPEQAEGDRERMDDRSDVYSLGVTLYELITGQVPFDAKTLPSLIQKILLEEPRPPSALRAGVDPRLDEVILRCLAKEPEDRYADAGEVAAALNGCMFSLLPEKAPLREVLYGHRRTDGTYVLKSAGIIVAAILAVPLICIVTAIWSRPSQRYPEPWNDKPPAHVTARAVHDEALGLRAAPSEDGVFDVARADLVLPGMQPTVILANRLFRSNSELGPSLAEALRLSPRGQDRPGEDVRYPSNQTLRERAAAITAAWDRVLSVNEGRMPLRGLEGYQQIARRKEFLSDAETGRWAWVPVERGALCPWVWVRPDEAYRLLRASFVGPQQKQIRVYEVPLTGHTLRVLGEGLVSSIIGRPAEGVPNGKTFFVPTVEGTYGFELKGTKRGLLLVLWPKSEGRGWLVLMDLTRPASEDDEADLRRLCRQVGDFKGELIR